MTRTSGSRSPIVHNMNLTIRTRDPLAQNDIITPAAGKFISNQADRCPFPGCTNVFSHQHSTAEGKIAPSVEKYRKAGEAIRERWTEEQRRRIAENEAMLRQLAKTESKVGRLSNQTHLPRGNDLTVQEQIAIIRGGATPAQDAHTRETPLERQQAEQTQNLEWDDFPELDAQYAPKSAAGNFENLDPAIGVPPNSSSEGSCKSRVGSGLPFDTTIKVPSTFQETDFLNRNPPCTGPCPVQHPHNQGAYLRQGQVPRLWNARWGYSDPPRAIWEAWVRIEQGHGSSWDQVEVDGFALSHWWAGP